MTGLVNDDASTSVVPHRMQELVAKGTGSKMI